MRYTEYGAMDVHSDLILTVRKTYCRGPVVNLGMTYILVSINQIVIFNHSDKHHLAKVIDIRESENEVVAQCYEPPISLSSYIRYFNEVKDNTNISCKNTIASFIDPPVYGRRNQLSLSEEQFIDIQKFCT